MIAVINSGGGNLASILNALERLKIDSRLTQNHEEIKSASHVILPGVGAAEEGMKNLRDLQLVEIIRSIKQPFLGICLGMQLLYEASDEGDAKTLGLFPGRVEKMKSEGQIRIPHMGWNQVDQCNGGSVLLNDIEEGSYFYFVHSYKGATGEWVKGKSCHGSEFPALIEKDNFFGTQFHPERSGLPGAQLLENFVKL